jgi:hypothetical protein
VRKLLWIAALVSGFGTTLAETPKEITFYKDVLPILQSRCQECHRPGEAAPMPLLSYQQARPWAKAIRDAVLSGKMPPWHADPHIGKFSNARTLTGVEREVLTGWAAGGAKEGNPKDAPAPKAYTDGWTIGKPDVIIDMGTDYTVPASGTIQYTYFVAPTGFTEDKWIEKIEVRPGSRAVVHHIVVEARRPGAKRFSQAKPGVPFVPEKSQDSRDPRPDTGAGNLGVIAETEIVTIFVPGGDPYQTRPGQARLIKAGSDLIIQMHYTAAGKETVDRSRVGIIFAKEPPKERVANLFIDNRRFKIPAGTADHRAEGRVTLQDDAVIQAIFPHAHVRGKAYEVSVKRPGGQPESILRVPKYDFNWQHTYYLEEPLKLPKGTEVTIVGWYDNSPNNRFNPDPSKEVYWGDQTWEEMLIVFFDFVTPRDYDLMRLRTAPRAVTGAAGGE